MRGVGLDGPCQLPPEGGCRQRGEGEGHGASEARKSRTINRPPNRHGGSEPESAEPDPHRPVSWETASVS